VNLKHLKGDCSYEFDGRKSGWRISGLLKQRIDSLYEKMAGTLSHHRVLIKTERAEAEVILRIFLKILNNQSK
jgi:hypothetical protein